MTVFEQLSLLSRYNQWMNGRLYGVPLDEEQRTREMGAYFGSVRGTLNHLLIVDSVWMMRLSGDRQRFALRDRDGVVIRVSSSRQLVYADFSEMTERRSALDRDITAWVDGLTEQTLARDLRWKDSSEMEFEQPFADIVMHMFNHQTHHRGQVTTLIKQLGHDPGVTDYVIFAAQYRRGQVSGAAP
jgi:uncharacterized damage-inducible protein DinB